MARQQVCAFALAALAVALLVCVNGAAADVADVEEVDVVVLIEWFLNVTPVDETVNIGETVIFQNTDEDMVHSVNQTNGDTLNSGEIAKQGEEGDSYTFVPTKAQDIYFECDYHPSMHGVLHVVDNSDGSGSSGGGAFTNDHTGMAVLIIVFACSVGACAFVLIAYGVFFQKRRSKVRVDVFEPLEDESALDL